MHLDWAGHGIEIREIGAGGSAVLLHGYPLDGAMWSGVARVLAPGLRVLKPDLPGHGENAAPAPDSIDGQADFVEALLAQLPGPVGLAGFSMGGYVALALMKRQPEKVRALALVDTRAGADDEAGRAKRDEAIATVRSGGVAPIAQAMLGKLLSPEGLKKADLVERASRIMTRQKPETVAADHGLARSPGPDGVVLPSIAVPTLVVVGEVDAITPLGITGHGRRDPRRPAHRRPRRWPPGADGTAARGRRRPQRLLRASSFRLKSGRPRSSALELWTPQLAGSASGLGSMTIMGLFGRSSSAPQGPVRLHVGSGSESIPGWINIDNHALPGVDHVLDVRRGLPFRDVRSIYAEHFLEHLSLDEGLAFLVECRRALSDQES